MDLSKLLGAFSVRDSRLGRMILGLNLLGLTIIIGGSLIFNEFSQALVASKQEALMAQAKLTAEVISEVATVGVPIPYLEANNATFVLARFIPNSQRARLFGSDGNILSDSFSVSEDIRVEGLAPITKKQQTSKKKLDQNIHKADQQLRDEIERALDGEAVANVRLNEEGKKIVSVSVPLRRVKAILGVLTLESGDFDTIIMRQRWAILPFALVALGVTILSSVLMHVFISHPILRLSEAADQVRLDKAREISLPGISSRKDELGTLARSLSAMTAVLSKRLDEIERFAADVSHEIKNPLTSIRSALETIGIVQDEAAKKKLMAVINHDVRRLDRLITDISNASRLDAELSRDTPKPFDVSILVKDIISFYNDSAPQKATISLKMSGPSTILGREGPLGQVFRNLIDNARSFCQDSGDIKISLEGKPDEAMLFVTIEDDGPGIPQDALERIFERFYTSRPKEQGFGKNSGLGLSIVRQIVEAHKGTIKAQNRTRGDGTIIGASFVIQIPLFLGQ